MRPSPGSGKPRASSAAALNQDILRVAEQDYGCESRIIAVGPAGNGALLELVVVPADEPTE